MENAIPHLLNEIFNHDFARAKDTAALMKFFFARPLPLSDLRKVYALVSSQSVHLGGKTIPAAIRIPGSTRGTPFAILAQLHGNEPAGLAGILMAMALSQAGALKRDVIGVIGNPLAAGQYFEALEKQPKARQESRDAYRCGLGGDGSLLPDMNRIPVDFLKRDPASPHIKRAQELWALGNNICGIADIHSARGNMVCITDHKRDSDLKSCPIRAILTDLAAAISAHASSASTVQTLKTILSPLPNIECQIGIEAGRHEDPNAPKVAAEFILSLMHTLGLTMLGPCWQEDGHFTRYAVRPRLTYADLILKGTLEPGDMVHMARGGVIGRFAPHQYEEMEAITQGQVVAVARPSGATFHAPWDFAGIFFSKPAELYDKDPSVGPWPVPVEKLAQTKFCYPCDVSKLLIDFKN